MTTIDSEVTQQRKLSIAKDLVDEGFVLPDWFIIGSTEYELHTLKIMMLDAKRRVEYRTAWSVNLPHRSVTAAWLPRVEYGMSAREADEFLGLFESAEVAAAFLGQHSLKEPEDSSTVYTTTHRILTKKDITVPEDANQVPSIAKGIGSD